MLIGPDVYACYGVKHSKLEHNVKRRKGLTILNMTGIALSVLSVITGLWHQQTVGWEEDKTLLAISFVFAFTHCAFYMVRITETDIREEEVSVFHTLSVSITFIHRKGVNSIHPYLP